MIHIERKYHFYGAHRNRKAGEKCSRIHGHTYEILCRFSFPVGIQIEGEYPGVQILFNDIDMKVEPIIKAYDHHFLLWDQDPLCELLELADEIFIALPFETSAENLSVWLFTRIKNETHLPITRISLAETKSSNIIYEPQSF